MSTIEHIRSIHLLSDKKFVPWVQNTFTRSNWKSDYIIMNHRKKKFSVSLGEDTMEVSADRFGKKIILEHLKEYDIVFHYFLDNLKAEIIDKSPEHLVHCWCFYGAEVYQQTNLFRKNLYGPQTRKLLSALPEIRFRYDLRKLYYKYILFRETPIDALHKAIPHIHSILWYVEDEIQFINTKLKLPTWQFFQFFSFSDIIPNGALRTNPSSKRILIGNSATIENNHLDALPELAKIKENDYRFSLPMTYGQFSRYKSAVKKNYAKELGERAEFLEDHQPLEAYYNYLQTHPTAIFLHHRQQGLGNILYLLYTGTKIYLSKNNIIFTWLDKNGIKVFKFEEDFAVDVLNNQLTLDEQSMNSNQEKIVELLNHDKNENTIQLLEKEVYTRRDRK